MSMNINQKEENRSSKSKKNFKAISDNCTKKTQAITSSKSTNINSNCHNQRLLKNITYNHTKRDASTLNPKNSKKNLNSNINYNGQKNYGCHLDNTTKQKNTM